jgi:antitoxin (DNA-binding transcriptional repressor) of toxin-antitoxin stability system
VSSAEVSVRELRNNTRSVLDAIEAGSTVYLTSHGRRIAEIRPLPAAADADVQRLIDEVNRMPVVDSGAREELDRDKAASVRAERERESRLWR